MPANSAEYQKKYRQKTKAKRKVISVALNAEDYRDIEKYAKAQEMKLSTLLREATLHQVRNSQMHSKSVETELKELRFLVSGIANSLEHMAHQSVTLRQTVNENAVLTELQKLDTLIVDFTQSRHPSKP